MRRLLAWAPAPIAAAATRYRLAQYAPQLARAGIELILRPFLDEDGFAVLYSAGHRAEKIAAATRALAGRLRDLVDAARVDAVLIHREAALVGPPLLEWICARALHKPLLFDLDDPVWVAYASPTYGAVLSRLLKAPDKTYFTLAAARQIIAGSPHLAEFARRYNDAVTTIPTVVDSDVWIPAAQPNNPPVVGWVGTHSSSAYLRALFPALRQVAQKRKFTLRLVGISQSLQKELADLGGVDVDVRSWALDRELPDFQSLDIGLYPLADDEWALGKSGFKAVQYMAVGVPVIASPIGVARDLVRPDHNGYWATSTAEWVARLEALLDDAALRRRLGEAGRADVEQKWCARVQGPRLVTAVESVLCARNSA